MQKPLMEEIEVLEPLGGSANGRVYRARDAAGADVVLKVFHEPSIRRDLLGDSTRLLEDAGWPEGVLPVLAAEFDEIPSVRLTPALLDETEDGTVVPRSLQHHFESKAEGNVIGLARGIARALAGMHRCGVVHGNLKPCNVMFGQDGEVFLTDWMLGNMPGVHEFHFTDALLYQPPEQLTHAVALEEAGKRWDVFAFGVLIFRLVTGRFPRCHDTYQKVAPPFGQACGDARLVVDLEKVAANVLREPAVDWPDESGLLIDPVLRDVLERCLVLDWQARPASMEEVLDLLVVEKKAGQDRPAGEPASPLTAHVWWRIGFALVSLAAVISVVGAVVYAKRWKQALAESHRQLIHERDSQQMWQLEKNDLVAAYEKAVIARTAAQGDAEMMREDLRYERDLGRARLEASREVGDQLFAWAMEKGHRRLPPLDGRELRLKRLERYYVDFLDRTEEVKELADERARMRLQLAEISLAAGDGVQAASRLDEAFQALSDMPMDAEMRMRIATNRLLLAILKQSVSAKDAKVFFDIARKAFEEVPRSGVDENRIDQLMAVLDFHEAQLYSAMGNDNQALEQLMRATQTLNRLADEQADTAVLRSELAACYLSSATILEGIGNMGDAREVRTLAMQELKKLLEENPDDMDLKLDLAGCMGAMAEASVLSGDITGAESLSREVMGHLEEILLRQPENADAIARRAAQLGLRAGILRDRGFADEAMEDYEEGIRTLEAMRASSRGHALSSYRLALLLWQKGRMLGTDGKRDREIELLNRAKSLLAELETGKGLDGPRHEQIQRSAVYVLGDLGHALHISGQKDKALEVFRDALVLWEALSRSRPRSEEYSEGLVWCRQRVKEME
jgi:tetratricopeptide (TPR) repeat protein